MAEVINMEYARKKMEEATTNVVSFGTVKKFGDITVTLRRSNPFHTDGYDIDEEDLEEFYAWKKAGSIPCYEIVFSAEGYDCEYNFRDYFLAMRNVEKKLSGRSIMEEEFNSHKEYEKVISDSSIRIMFDKITEDNINKIFKRFNSETGFYYRVFLLDYMAEVFNYVIETIDKVKDPVENYVHEYFEAIRKSGQVIQCKPMVQLVWE